MRLSERITQFDFDPFPYTLDIVVTNDLKASRLKWLKKHTTGEIPESDGTAKALTISHPAWDFSCILLNRKATLEEIAHEVTHAVLNFTRYIEMKPMPDEMLAYYIGYYTNKIAAFVLKK